MNDEDIIEQNKKFRLEAEQGNQGTFQRMSRCERFRIGDQWDKDVLKRSKMKRKHTLTINRIHPIVLQIAGQQVQNPRDFRVVFQNKQARVRANLLTALAKQVMDSSYAQRVTSLGFENGTTTGRGFIGVDIDYTNDPSRGDLNINQYDPFTVLPDPCCKNYNFNHPKHGAKYIFVDEWVDKKKLEIQYPGHKDKLQAVNYNYIDGGSYFSRLTGGLFGGSQQCSCPDTYRCGPLSDYGGMGGFDDPYANNYTQEKNNYRRSTVWWVEHKKGVYLQSIDDPLEYLMFYKPKDIKTAKVAVEENPKKLRLIDKDPDGLALTVGVLHKSTQVGDVLLKDIEDPFKGMMMIPIVKFTPYFVNGYEFGAVQGIIGPQMLYNWSRSMFLNLTKQLANTGWIVGKAGSKARQFLERHGSEDGVIINKQDYGTVEKVKQNEPNQDMLIIGEQTKLDMAESSNVRLESPQTDKDRVAAAIRLKQASAFTGSASLFSNWDFTYELLGSILVELIRRAGTYTSDEIKAIVDKEDLVDPRLVTEAREKIVEMFRNVGMNLQNMQPEPPDAQMLSQYSPEVAQSMLEGFQQEGKQYGEIAQKIDFLALEMAEEMLFDELDSVHKGRLGIKVSMSSMAESMRAIKFQVKAELHKLLVESNLPGLSRRSLIEAADPPDKEQILAEPIGAPATAQAVRGNQ